MVKSKMTESRDHVYSKGRASATDINEDACMSSRGKERKERAEQVCLKMCDRAQMENLSV